MRHAWIVAAILGPLVFAMFFVFPLGSLVATALTDGDVGDELTSGETWRAMRLSLVTATITLGITLLLGTPLAYWLTRTEARPVQIAATLIDLPLVLPPTVAGIALLTAFGRGGYLGEPLGEIGVELSFTTAAVVIAQLFVSAPFYIRAAVAGFAAVDRRLEGVGYTLGLSRWRVFRSVTVPMALPAILGGAVLCWARAIGELGATLLFAGSLPGETETMPLAILAAFESEAGLAGAVSISVVLLGFAFVLLVALRMITPERRPYG